jgi:hypothetical protein
MPGNRDLSGNPTNILAISITSLECCTASLADSLTSFLEIPESGGLEEKIGTIDEWRTATDRW